MGDTRIRYGLAYGRMNNFVTGSTDQTKRGYLAGTDGLFKQADTTPDVTNGYLFYANNSAATTITDFKLQHPSAAGSNNLAGLFEGKVIKIIFLDTVTTVANNSRVLLADSANTLFNKNSTVEFLYHTSAWYEMCRSEAIGLASSYTKNVTIASTAESISITNNDMLVVLSMTGLTSIFRGITGGYEGQRIILAKSLADTGSSITFAHTNSSGIGNIYFRSTAEFMMTVIASGGLQTLELVKVGTGWFVPTLITA